jgi:hypothetical protein
MPAPSVPPLDFLPADLRSQPVVLVPDRGLKPHQCNSGPRLFVGAAVDVGQTCESPDCGGVWAVDARAGRRPAGARFGWVLVQAAWSAGAACSRVTSKPSASSWRSSRRDDHRDPACGDLLHLLLVPVAGAGDDHRRLLTDTHQLEFPFDGGDDRGEVPEVG